MSITCVLNDIFGGVCAVHTHLYVEARCSSSYFFEVKFLSLDPQSAILVTLEPVSPIDLPVQYEWLQLVFFTRVLGTRTRVLMLSQQALYPLSHLPSPMLFETVLLCSPGWLINLRSSGLQCWDYSYAPPPHTHLT